MEIKNLSLSETEYQIKYAYDKKFNASTSHDMIYYGNRLKQLIKHKRELLKQQ